MVPPPFFIKDFWELLTHQKRFYPIISKTKGVAPKINCWYVVWRVTTLPLSIHSFDMCDESNDKDAKLGKDLRWAYTYVSSNVYFFLRGSSLNEISIYLKQKNAWIHNSNLT